IAQRLVRAKRQLRDADVAFELTGADYPARLESVLDVLYLLFNEGYAAHTRDNPVRAELCREAVRLRGLLADARPQICADGAPARRRRQAARLPARTGGDAGEVLLRLAEQDRARWDASAIARGLHHLEAASAGETLTVYHLEAGIAACHAVAARYEATDWANIV